MRTLLGILGVAALAATPALAHEGPRFWIGNDAGVIKTYTSDNDFDPTVYTASRVFTTEFESFFGIFTTEFPGFEVRRDGGNVPADTTFGFNVRGPALYFDALNNVFVSTQAMFGPPAPGPVPQLAVSLGASVIATSTGPVAGFDFFTFYEIGDHSHLAFTLLGDGVHASDGPDGVYVLQLNLTSQSLGTSADFYLLIGKGVAVTDPVFQAAVFVAQTTLAPTDIPGDVNCDGVLDGGDAGDFARLLVDPVGYSAAHPGCPASRGDMNSDQRVDGLDIQEFVEALLSSGGA